MTRSLALSLVAAGLFSLAMRPWGSGYFAIAGATLLVAVLMRERVPWRGGLVAAVAWLGMAIPSLEGTAAILWWSFPALLGLLGLGWVIAGTVFVWLRERLSVGVSLLALPVLFTASEFAFSRTWLLGDAALGLLAYTQADTLLRALAPWSGTSAVNIGLLLLATGIYSLLARRWTRAIWSVAAVVAALLVPVPGTSAIWMAGELRAGAVQGSQRDIDRLMAAYDDRVGARLAGTYEELISHAAAQGAELVILPETVLPRSTVISDPSPHLVSMLSAAPVTLVGVHEYAGDETYNSAAVWTGTELDPVYRKQALVPVIESSYTAGTSSDPVMLQAARVGLGICLDSVQPGISREAVRRGAELLIYITDDTFAGITSTPYFHLRTAMLRAAETARATLFVNESGPSAVLDARGKTLDTLQLGEQGVMVAELPLMTGITPFVAVGDLLGWFCLLSGAVYTVFHVFAPQRKRQTGAAIDFVSD